MKRVLFLSAVFALFALPLLTALPASAVKEGEVCGGFTNAKCDKGLFCEYPAGQCAATAGVCEKTPDVCPKSAVGTKTFIPVCACGGKQFPGDCERKQAGARKDHDGPCEEKEMK